MKLMWVVAYVTSYQGGGGSECTRETVVASELGIRTNDQRCETTAMIESKRTNRRTVLRTIGAGVIGGTVLGTGTAAGRGHRGRPKPDTHEYHAGESVEVEGGTVEAYATTKPAGDLSSIGVHLDCRALRAFAAGGAHHEDMFMTHLDFPDGVDTHQFTFNGFYYSPEGHPPPGIYDVPHFDIHFNFIEEEVVEAISGGPLGETPLPFLGLAAYDVPDEQFPPGYEFEELRFIVERMGEHLIDGTAPEFHGERFTHTNVYGVYDRSIDPDEPDDWVELPLDPEGDPVEVPVYGATSEGELIFIEPMITTEFLRRDLEEETAVELATPERYPVADEYPTEYVMTPDGAGGVFVSLDSFESFPGRC